MRRSVLSTIAILLLAMAGTPALAQEAKACDGKPFTTHLTAPLGADDKPFLSLPLEPHSHQCATIASMPDKPFSIGYGGMYFHHFKSREDANAHWQALLKLSAVLSPSELKAPPMGKINSVELVTAIAAYVKYGPIPDRFIKDVYMALEKLGVSTKKDLT